MAQPLSPVGLLDGHTGGRVDGRETSPSPSLAQPVFTLVWKDGLATLPEQPLPAPLHTVSLHPRVLLTRVNEADRVMSLPEARS
jgi:hypothetical protein